MTLINYIRANQADGMKVEDAVERAVIRCIEEKILEKILKKNRAEVVSVCITEYNEEVFINGIKEEGREEGKIIAIIKISRKYSATDEQCIENIMNELKVTREKAEEHYRKYSKNIEEN